MTEQTKIQNKDWKNKPRWMSKKDWIFRAKARDTKWSKNYSTVY